MTLPSACVGPHITTILHNCVQICRDMTLPSPCVPRFVVKNSSLEQFQLGVYLQMPPNGGICRYMTLPSPSPSPQIVRIYIELCVDQLILSLIVVDPPTISPDGGKLQVYDVAHSCSFPPLPPFWCDIRCEIELLMKIS